MIRFGLALCGMFALSPGAASAQCEAKDPRSAEVLQLYSAMQSVRSELRALAILKLVTDGESVPCQTEDGLLKQAFEAAQQSEFRSPFRLRDPSHPSDAAKLLSWLDGPFDRNRLENKIVLEASARGHTRIASEMIDRLDLSPAPSTNCSAEVIPDPQSVFRTVVSLIDAAYAAKIDDLTQAAGNAFWSVLSSARNVADLSVLINARSQHLRGVVLSRLLNDLRQPRGLSSFSPLEFHTTAEELTKAHQTLPLGDPARSVLIEAERSWLSQYSRSAECRLSPDAEQAVLKPLFKAWASDVTFTLPKADPPQLDLNRRALKKWRSLPAYSGNQDVLSLLLYKGQLIAPGSERSSEWRARFELLKRAVRDRPDGKEEGDSAQLAKADGLFTVLLLSPRAELSDNAAAYASYLAAKSDLPLDGLLLVGQAISQLQFLKQRNPEAFAVLQEHANRVTAPCLRVLFWLQEPRVPPTTP